MIHKSCVSLKSESMREPQFLVLSPMLGCSPRLQHMSRAADHRKVFPEINGRAEPKMTERAPSGMLIYQGFTCWLMIAITVCIWQTQLDMCSEKLYLKLDYTGSIQFPLLLLGLSSQSLSVKFVLFTLIFRKGNYFCKKGNTIEDHIKLTFNFPAFFRKIFFKYICNF